MLKSIRDISMEYHRWHQKPYCQVLHWSVFISVAVLLMVMFSLGEMGVSGGISMAHAQSVTNYYVDAVHGNDSNDGASPATAWKTIAKANSSHTAGSTVNIMPGEYREKLYPKSGLSADQHTVYSGYGDRSVIKILGSAEITNWTQCTSGCASTNVYRAAYTPQKTYPGSYPISCFEDRTRWLLPQTILANVNSAGKMYYDSASGTVYAWASTGAPSAHQIECTDFSVASWDEEYSSPKWLITNFTLQNVTIMETFERGITLGGTAHDITIQNSEFSFTGGTAGGNPAAIYHGSDGSYSPHAVNISVIGNKIHDVGSNYGPAGLATSETAGSHCGNGLTFYDVKDSLVDNNTIYNTCAGIDLKGGNGNVTIQKNTIKNTARDGIRLACLNDNNIIQENVIYGILGWNAVTIGKESDNNVIRQNVIYDMPGNAVLTYVGECGLGTVPATGTIAKNNILMGHSNDLGIIDGTSAADINYNLFDSSAATPSFLWSGSTLSLSSWRTASGFDANSLAANPSFDNPAGGDFSLNAGSPAIDAGVVISGYHCAQSDDVNPGQTGCRHWRGAAPDIGAFEYGTTVPDTTPPARVTNLTAR